VVYLDDIVVYGNTFEQHLERLSAVFQKSAVFFQKVQVFSKKCRFFKKVQVFQKSAGFFQRKITFRGHVISADGIAPDPEKVESILL
jgi:hypothetical protein